MKRLLMFALVISSLFAIAGCSNNGQSPSPFPAATTTPDIRAAIEVGRSIGRVGITVALQQRGIPANVTSLALAELDADVITPALDGGTFTLASDPATWKPVRDELVARGSTALVKAATSNGVPLLDEATAKVLVSEFVDTIAAQAKAAATRKSNTL
jgi:predicted small lipoprotein YifL